MIQSLILKRPVVSEKSLNATGWQEYTFMVDKKASKKTIAQAVKEAFGVDVKKVRTLVVKGKTRRSYKTRKEYRLSPWKKAIVQIGKDQKIDLFETGGQPSPKASAGKKEEKK